jgi:hypothetical protein
MIGTQSYVIQALRSVRQREEPESHLICRLDKQRVDSVIFYSEKPNLPGSLSNFISGFPELGAIARSQSMNINQGQAVFWDILILQRCFHFYGHSDRPTTIDPHLSK